MKASEKTEKNLDRGTLKKVYVVPVKAGLLTDNGGFIALKNLFWLVILFLAAYGGYMFIPPSFSYYMMKSEVENEVKTAHMYSDDRILARIKDKAKSWSIDLEDENIEITREYENIGIRVRYKKKLVFFNKYKKVLVYDIRANKPLKTGETTLQ